MPEHDAQNLTGIWQGYYLYPRGGTPVSFVATLLESGRFVTGTTHEAATQGRVVGQTLYAMLNGGRTGATVGFVKHYTHSGENIGYEMPITYEGLISADGTQIEGNWTIHAGFFGRFAMIRPKRAETQHQQHVVVETRAR
jgi:hypothetical protein